MAREKRKIIDFPLNTDEDELVRKKKELVEKVNHKLTENRMKAVFEEFEIIKYYLNLNYELSLKSVTDEDERDLLAKEHQEDLEVWETEFSFRTSELLTNYEQNNLLSICLKRYGIT